MAGLWDFMSPGGLWNTPGYGDGLPQNGYRLPDQMPAINDALAQNAALPPPKPSFAGRGGALWDIIGAIGDGFSGKDTYAQGIQQNRALEADQAKYEKRQAAEQAQWLARQQFEKDSYRPTTAKDADYYRSQGQPDYAADLEAKDRMVPIQRADPVTGEVRYEYVRPSALSGGGQGAGRPTTQAEYQAMKPGDIYTAPDGTQRRKGGQSQSNGSGGFRF